MFSWFRSKPSPREMWLQIYEMHVGMGTDPDSAAIFADHAVKESQKYPA